MSARASKRAQRAMSGRSSKGGDGQTTITAADGRKTTSTNGSVINWGGDEKFGLYPTVGVSIGFLNMLDACCRSPFPRSGVNVNDKAGQWNTFMNF